MRQHREHRAPYELLESAVAPLRTVSFREHERRAWRPRNKLLAQKPGLLGRERDDLAATLLAQIGRDHERSARQVYAIVGERNCSCLAGGDRCAGRGA